MWRKRERPAGLIRRALRRFVISDAYYVLGKITVIMPAFLSTFILAAVNQAKGPDAKEKIAMKNRFVTFRTPVAP